MKRNYIYCPHCSVAVATPELDRVKSENASLRHQVLELTEQNRAYLAEITKLHNQVDERDAEIGELNYHISLVEQLYPLQVNRIAKPTTVQEAIRKIKQQDEDRG